MRASGATPPKVRSAARQVSSGVAAPSAGDRPRCVGSVNGA